MQTHPAYLERIQNISPPDRDPSVGPPRLSDLLQAVVDAPVRPEERIYLGNLIDSFGNRAFGALIFIFALPVAVPIAIPGISALLGAPLLLLTWQLMRGRAQPWLPDIMRNRSFRRKDFGGIVSRVLPWVRWLERLVRPRLSILAIGWAERIIGALAFVLALILFLPVPFGNTVPALGIAILALALLERDGIAVLAGATVGCTGITIVSGVTLALVQSAILLVQSVIQL
ncbi:MAG: exopolysaccharide biosynthesis protein [Roseovarius sp.]